MKESDWKIFKEIKEKAIESYCAMVLKEFSEVINDEDEHVHNRYLLLFELVQNRNKEMSLIFDGHSRSRAHIQLLLIRREDLADPQLLEQLSSEFRDETDPDKILPTA